MGWSTNLCESQDVSSPSTGKPLRVDGYLLLRSTSPQHPVIKGKCFGWCVGFDSILGFKNLCVHVHDCPYHMMYMYIIVPKQIRTEPICPLFSGSPKSGLFWIMTWVFWAHASIHKCFEWVASEVWALINYTLENKQRKKETNKQQANKHQWKIHHFFWYLFLLERLIFAIDSIRYVQIRIQGGSDSQG